MINIYVYMMYKNALSWQDVCYQNSDAGIAFRDFVPGGGSQTTRQLNFSR